MKYILPAFAVLWLAMIYVSLFDGGPYVVAQLSFPDGNTAIIQKVDPQAAALGLRPGMRIDRTHMSFADRLRLRYGVHEGTQLRLPIESNHTYRVIAMPALHPRTTEPVAQRIFSAVTMTFSLLLVAFLGFRRPGVMIGALILYLGGGAMSWPSFAVLFSALPDPLYIAACVLLAALCDWFPVLVLAAFAVRFPGDNPSSEHRTAIRIIDGIVIAGFLAALSDVPFITNAVYVLFTALSAVVVIAASVVALRYAKPADRARVGIVFASVIIGGVGYAANMIWLRNGGNYVFFILYAGLSVIIVPLAVAYAIVRHRVFDIAFVVNRTLVYAITSALVLVALAAMEFAAERYLSSLTRVEGIAVEFGFALVVIVSVRMVHTRVDRIVDNVLFRDRHQQESALRRFATTLPFYTEQAPLLRDTVDCLVRFGRVEGAAVYLPEDKRLASAASSFPVPAPAIDENDPAYVELRAHREQLQIHRLSTSFLGDRLYPMFLSGRLEGVISIGERESGEHMPPDIDDAIARIASALAVSLAAIETDRVRAENVLLHARLADAAT